MVHAHYVLIIRQRPKPGLHLTRQHQVSQLCLNVGHQMEFWEWHVKQCSDYRGTWRMNLTSLGSVICSMESSGGWPPELWQTAYRVLFCLLIPLSGKRRKVKTPLGANKFLFKKYVLLFPEGREAVNMKRYKRINKSRLASHSPQTSPAPVQPQPLPRPLAPSALTVAASLLQRRNLSPAMLRWKMEQVLSAKAKVAATSSNALPPDPTDTQLLQATIEAECSLTSGRPFPKWGGRGSS